MKINLTKLILGAATLVCAAGSYATWANSYLTQAGHQVIPAAMTEDSNGNVYVLGTVEPSDTKFVIQKINSSGTVVADVEFGNGADFAYDITMGTDGNLVMLGSEGSYMYAASYTTSLTNSWTNATITPCAGNGGTTSQFQPFRVVSGSKSGATVTYVTAQVEETASDMVDITLPTNKSAACYVQLNNSGAVNYTGGWDGVTGQPDVLYGAHAVSNGLVLVTDTKSSISGSYYSRAHFTKISDASATTQWSSEVGFSSSFTNRIHKLSKSDQNGDIVFVGFENSTAVSWQTDTATEEWISRVDCSATSAPAAASWTYSFYNLGLWIYSNATKPNQHNHSGGVCNYHNDYVACGWGDYADIFNQNHVSWLRGESGGQYNGDSTTTLTIQSNGTLRSFHGVNGIAGISNGMAALYRNVSGTSWYYWSTGTTAGSTKTITTDFGAGYSGAPVHVYCSKANIGTAYVVMTLTDNSGNYKTGLYSLN